MHAFLRLTQTGGSSVFVNIGSIQRFYPSLVMPDSTRIDFVGDEEDFVVVKESSHLIRELLEATDGVSLTSIDAYGNIKCSQPGDVYKRLNEANALLKKYDEFFAAQPYDINEILGIEERE